MLLHSPFAKTGLEYCFFGCATRFDLRVGRVAGAEESKFSLVERAVVAVPLELIGQRRVVARRIRVLEGGDDLPARERVVRQSYGIEQRGDDLSAQRVQTSAG